MLRRTSLLVVLAVLVALGAIVALRRDHAARPVLLAHPVRTPGVLNPEVTQATIGTTVCVRGWTQTIRPPSEYTSSLKRRQMREYGVGGDPADYEEDHLVSLALGGHPDDPRNLWPEPQPRARRVDGLERDLHRRVCAGELSLADAQQRIADEKHVHG
jgi:hypothetical protein